MRFMRVVLLLFLTMFLNRVGFGQKARVITPELEITIVTDSIIGYYMYYTLEISATSDNGLYIYLSDDANESNEITVGLHKFGYGLNVLDGQEYELDFLKRQASLILNGKIEINSSFEEIYVTIDYLVLNRQKYPEQLVVNGKFYNREAKMIYLYFPFPSTLPLD